MQRTTYNLIATFASRPTQTLRYVLAVPRSRLYSTENPQQQQSRRQKFIATLEKKKTQLRTKQQIRKKKNEEPKPENTSIFYDIASNMLFEIIMEASMSMIRICIACCKVFD